MPSALINPPKTPQVLANDSTSWQSVKHGNRGSGDAFTSEIGAISDLTAFR